jgi:hypothetical protein
MDTSEARNRKVVAVEQFDLEVPETAHQISSGSFLILYLWIFVFVFIVLVFCLLLLFFGESTCRLLHNLELFLKKTHLLLGGLCSFFH